MLTPRTTPRRRSRVALAVSAALLAAVTGVLAPTAASATPNSAAEAGRLVQEAAQRLTALDEQVHQAELTVQAHQEAADAAAEQAAAARAALDVHEPALRAIAKSGYTGKTQSRVSAFLTSGSADELVQQMTTLDMIAHHTNAVVGLVAAAQDAAEQAQITADELAATAHAALAQLEEQKVALQEEAAGYQADFARLSAAERARVTTAIAGPDLGTPRNLPIATTAAAATAIQVALSKVGSRYDYGGSGPDVFDCSGLTQYAYAAAGVSLPHSSRAQSSLGHRVERSELQPGDLVFYSSSGGAIDHVALYIGNGMIVHARTYGVPLSVTSVDQGGYRWAVRLT